MTESKPTLNSNSTSLESISLFRCLTNAALFGAIAFGFYKMTQGIAHQFAVKPIHSDQYMVVQISAAVRTLIVGLLTMGTGVFSFFALGLILLAFKIMFQKLIKPNPSQSDA